MPGLEILYLSLFLIGVFASGLLMWWGRRRTDQGVARSLADPLDFTRPVEAPISLTTSAPSRATPTELPAVVVDDLSHRPPIAQLLFATGKRGDHKECPRCKRRFGETVVLCPFDSAPLRSLNVRARKTTRPAITGSRRPTCTSCGRRYESSAKHCYHDGTALSTDSPPEVPIIRACRNCGHESFERVAFCGCDDPEMVEIDPSRSAVQMPTIPLMHCRRCGFMSEPGTTTCPHDAELLYPVMNVQLNALPPTGLGPKRRVCEECGRKFSTSANYCAFDGSRLRDLN